MSPGAQIAVVIDDEPADRQAVAGMLRGCGMQVLEAANGSEALAFFDTQRISLAVTDLDIPQMNGIEFVARLVELSPQTPLVLMSRSNEKVLDLVAKLARGHGLSLMAVLKKPVEESDVRLVFELLTKAEA